MNYSRPTPWAELAFLVAAIALGFVMGGIGVFAMSLHGAGG